MQAACTRLVGTNSHPDGTCDHATLSLSARPGARQAQSTLSHLESPSGRLQHSKLKSSLSN